MADPTDTSCNNSDHASLVTTVSEQQRLITQLFAKIQDLERKLETREAAHSPAVSLNSPTQPPNFVTSAAEGGYVEQPNYPPAPPSAYETKKAQAQGQPCLYGSKCTREQCWYEHPGVKSAESSKPKNSTPSQSQHTGNSTKRIKKECNYGINCTRKQCWFEHPPEWVPPNDVAREPQPQPQQEFEAEAEAEAPAAQVDDWGTNEDLSNWGATSSNEWGTPVDNSWGPPAQADNSWGNPAETSSYTHPVGKQKSPANNSRSASVSASHEGSVSNSSTNRSRRKGRGKGRRADSESIATESTPMSPPAFAPTPVSAHDEPEPIPAQTPLPPPVQPIDQMSSFSEPNTSDEMWNTPSLESFGPSSSSEPEAPGTPKALWSDEPNVDVVYYPDPPPDLDPAEGQPTVQPADGQADLDQSAPSDLYTSWGVTGATASDWGLDPNEYPDPAPPVGNKSTGKKSKSKGKQKETFQTGTGRGTPTSLSSNFAAQPGTSTPSISEANEEEEQAPEPLPDPPKAVPQEEIPDWLLGVDEDAHAALGIARAQSPKPGATLAPPRLAPTNPAPRPPLSKLAGENFPTLSGILPTSKSSQSKDDTSSKQVPTFSPRPVGWKITQTSDKASSTSSKSGKSGKSKSDWGK